MKVKDSFLVVSSGDPAGIGSEVVLKTLDVFKPPFPVVVIGSRSAFSKVKRFAENVVMPVIHSPEDVKNAFQFPVLLEPEGTNVEFEMGRPSEETGKVAFKFFETALSFVLKHTRSALITAPLSKFWVAKTVDGFSGHTDFLRKKMNKPLTMVFCAKKMIVSLVSEHIPLRKVPEFVNENNVFETLKNTYSLMRNLGVEGKIGVCGLNPHAGENGSLGNEEEAIVSAVERFVKQYNVDVDVPLPSDVAFWKLRRKMYSALVCMYHDQGLGPFKMLHFNDGVNITAGLPFPRTSPDHGTAFDIAGKGIADFKSMLNAFKFAVRLLRSRLRGVWYE